MRRRKSSNNVVVYVAVPIAILFVLGAIGVIALIANRKNNGAEAEKLSDQLATDFESLTSTLESVKDEQTAKQAAKRIDEIAERIETNDKRFKKMKVSKAKYEELQRKAKARLGKVVPRFVLARERAMEVSNDDPALRKAVSKIDTLLSTSS